MNQDNMNNMNNMNGMSNMNNGKNNKPNFDFNAILKNKKLMIIIGVVLAILVVGIFLGGEMKENKIKKQLLGTGKSSSEYTKNVDIEEVAQLDNGSILVSIKNKNRDTITLYADVAFYDASNVKVDKDILSLVCFTGKSSVYDVIDKPSTDGIASHKILTENDSYNAYKALEEEGCLKSSDYTTEVSFVEDKYSPYHNVKITNKTNSSITVIGYLLYSLDGKYVAAKMIYESGIDPNGATISKAYVPTSGPNYDKIKYDKVEYVHTSAMSK